MRLVMWRRLFWATILPTTASVLALAGWLLYENRYNVEVWWYRQHLAEANTWAEAEPWQKKLWEPSARQARWTAAVRAFMQEESRADFWMLKGGPYMEDEATYYGAFLAEAARRPEICRAIVYGRRYAPRGKRWSDGTDADQPIDLLAEFQGIMETLRDNNANRSPGEYTWIVRVLCWCTYQDDLCRDLDFENWSEVYARWKSWIAENGPYQRFEPDTDRYRLDIELKQTRTPVPREAQLARSVDTPFPRWQGPLPQ